MGASEIIALLGVLVAVATYFAGVRRGRIQERQRREHEKEMEEDRRLHDLAVKMVDEYLDMARRYYDNGPHALARLGLHQLKSDDRIRRAIEQMTTRSAGDAWAGQGKHIQDINLVEFFKYVGDHKIDFFKTTVEETAEKVRAGQ